MPKELPEPTEFHWIKSCKGPQDVVAQDGSAGKDAVALVYELDNKAQVVVNCENLGKDSMCKISPEKSTCIFAAKGESLIKEEPEERLLGGKSIFPPYR